PLASSFPAIPPNIANRQNLHLFAPGISACDICPGATQKMSPALSADADKPHGDTFAGRDQSAPAKHRRGNKAWRCTNGGCSGNSSTKKTSAGDLLCAVHGSILDLFSIRKSKIVVLQGPSLSGESLKHGRHNRCQRIGANLILIRPATKNSK